MRALITGIAGFAGSHLASYLLEHSGCEVHGIVHRHDWRILHLRDQLTLWRGDLRNPVWVSELIERIRPDYILHLAAWSDVGGSWEHPWVTFELNVQTQLSLLEAVRRHAPACRMLIVGSNEMYGLIGADDLPIDEDTPLRPHSPYGVSKATQDLVAQQYFFSYKLDVVRVRPFNQVGPGQSDDFAAPAFARQIAEIESGQRAPVVRVGNLSSQRDFTDVRDMVHAYWLAIQHGTGGEAYNIGSGQSRSIQSILDFLLGESTCPIQVEVDPERLRPSDVPVSYADTERFRAATGWRPEIPFEDSLRDVLHDWRERVPRATRATATISGEQRTA